MYDILTFFRGTPDGKGSHDELAKKIGLAGKHWARDHVSDLLFAFVKFRNSPFPPYTVAEARYGGLYVYVFFSPSHYTSD